MIALPRFPIALPPPPRPLPPRPVLAGWCEVRDRGGRWLGLVETWPEVLAFAARRPPSTHVHVLVRMRPGEYPRPAYRFRVSTLEGGLVMAAACGEGDAHGGPH